MEGLRYLLNFAPGFVRLLGEFGQEFKKIRCLTNEKAVGRERRSQLSRTPISWHLLQNGRVADFKTVQALPRERADGGVAAGVPQVVEGFDRDVVVGVPKQRVALVGQGEKLRRAAATTELTANLALGDLTHSAGGNEPVEVAADRRGREAKARAQRTGALRPTVVQRPCDPVAGAGVVRASSSYCGRGRVGHVRKDETRCRSR